MITLNNCFMIVKIITMEAQQRIFFDFLKFCIEAVAEIPVSVKYADWKVQYAIAKKQALIGVLLHGIKQLPKELAPDADLLMTWMGLAQKIHQQNIRLFMDSVKDVSIRTISVSIPHMVQYAIKCRNSHKFTYLSFRKNLVYVPLCHPRWHDNTSTSRHL